MNDAEVIIPCPPAPKLHAVSQRNASPIACYWQDARLTCILAEDAPQACARKRSIRAFTRSRPSTRKSP